LVLKEAAKELFCQIRSGDCRDGFGTSYEWRGYVKIPNKKKRHPGIHVGCQDAVKEHNIFSRTSGYKIDGAPMPLGFD